MQQTLAKKSINYKKERCKRKMENKRMSVACICVLTGSLYCMNSFAWEEIAGMKVVEAKDYMAKAPRTHVDGGEDISISGEKEQALPIVVADVSGSQSSEGVNNMEADSGDKLIKVCLSGGIQEFFERGTAYVNEKIEYYGLSEEDLGQYGAMELLEEENEYADLAIANVDNYVNVRAEPNTDSAIVGKIYRGAVAHVLALAGEEKDWFQIVSGNAQGYIKAEYFFYGEDALAVIDDYVTRYAVVKADRLNVRENPGTEFDRIGYIDKGERAKLLEYTALDNGEEWIKVQYTDNSVGYVSGEYVNIVEEFVYAKTLEEEEKELAEKRALEARTQIPETQAAENTTVNVMPPNTDYSTNEELRGEIIDYAMQYLGNKYVHGGQTLAGGTDCSGFTSLIYAEFGYSLSRTPGGQLSGAGRGIDYSEAQPGDIICYGSGSTCTHVALYIGNGQIIHAANPNKGVVIGNAGYTTILGVRNVVD